MKLEKLLMTLGNYLNVFSKLKSPKIVTTVSTQYFKNYNKRLEGNDFELFIVVTSE